ncbi:MAG: divalent-cation tolerance protein CutA [Methanoregula sp.]|jgi:periplasmic divalent cation tolerance protein
MESSDIVVIFCTIPVTESEAMARAPVERRLVACVNIVPVHSCYSWNEEFCSEPEHLLIAKTKESMKTEVITAIRQLHSYEVPEIIAVPVIAGYAPYLAGVHAETKDEV